MHRTIGGNNTASVIMLPPNTVALMSKPSHAQNSNTFFMILRPTWTSNKYGCNDNEKNT